MRIVIPGVDAGGAFGERIDVFDIGQQRRAIQFTKFSGSIEDELSELNPGQGAEFREVIANGGQGVVGSGQFLSFSFSARRGEILRAVRELRERPAFTSGALADGIFVNPKEAAGFAQTEGTAFAVSPDDGPVN